MKSTNWQNRGWNKLLFLSHSLKTVIPSSVISKHIPEPYPKLREGWSQNRAMSPLSFHVPISYHPTAQIHNFTFHDLRHTFASELIMKGVDIKTVQEYLGHCSVAVTERYLHVAPNQKRVSIQL